VYFSPDAGAAEGDSAAPAGGRLHFLKARALERRPGCAAAASRPLTQFETSHVEECLNFIEAKGLHRCSSRVGGLAVVKATGGGAFRFADLFQQRLGLTFEKEDEMGCLVSGATFLLQELRDEAFTYSRGTRAYLGYLSPDTGDLFPYLLVNIGSGVSILRVTKDGHERISGTSTQPLRAPAAACARLTLSRAAQTWVAARSGGSADCSRAARASTRCSRCRLAATTLTRTCSWATSTAAWTTARR
jgi:type II pantothenate kinase